jgi:adenylate cyclase
MHWLGRHRLLIIAIICAFWTGLIFVGRIFDKVPFLFAPWSGEQNFEDMLRREGRKTPERDDFVFIGVDQQSLQLDALSPEEISNNRPLQLMTERPFPWSREVWALLLDRLFAAGARLVVFDMIFNPPNDGDAAFHDALERYRDRVVVGSNFDVSRFNQLVLPNTNLIAAPQAQDDRVGFVNFWPDASDGKVRAARFAISESQLADVAPFSGEEIFRSLSARALAKLGRADGILSDLGSHAIRFGPTGAYQPRNLYELFYAPTWRAHFADGAFFKDKVVIVGVSAQVMHDVVDTPLGPNTYGPALHLHTMAAALAREFLTYTPTSIGYLLVGAAGIAAWLLIAFVRRPLVAIVALVGISAAYLVITRFTYDSRGFLLLTIPVLSAFLFSGLISLGFEYAIERLEKLRTRRTLERYVSKNLVKEILENPDSFYSSLRGVRIPATILFSDIVGFTTMTESADPEALVKQLNEYLSRMTAAVFEHGGTLDKFIGDAVMAVWGNVSSHGKAEDAKSCARAALTMRRELTKLNQKWAAEGIPPFAIGIGVNHGDVLGGNIGSQEKADPTVIGDAVNLASRLEALTRTYAVDILVGEKAGELIRDSFHLRSVARVQVKGKTRPVEIFALLEERDRAFDPELVKWLETYEQGMAKFRERDFTQAKILFSRFLEVYPDDLLAKMYLDRALEYETAPPDDAWDAVEIFKKK